jgi:hypothetical protein
MAVRELSDKNPNGTRLGQSTTDLVGFWGKTPTSQRAGSFQASISYTAVVVNSASVSNLIYGFSTSAVAEGIILTLNEIRNVLVDAGLMKGSS